MLCYFTLFPFFSFLFFFFWNDQIPSSDKLFNHYFDQYLVDLLVESVVFSFLFAVLLNYGGSWGGV